MTFEETLGQVRELLQSKQRVSYRALKRQFVLDDDYLEDLKAELIDAERVAVDEDGKVLVWIGDRINGESEGKTAKGGKGEKEKNEKEVISSQLSAVSPQLLAPNTQHPAERRQLTVMFCDLVGFTMLSAQLDPEELREVVRAYQETSAGVIQRYDGHIAQHLGDGLLVYFGYPTAHEDDAVRAVRAGLEIIQALRKQVPSPLVGVASSSPSPLMGEGWGEGGKDQHSQTTPHPNLLPQGEKELRRLQVRIGIHTGLVVIGEIGSSEKREILALGETPNIAARVQGTANPDEVVISAATYHLVEGLFECEDRGQPELKGVATPLTLYRVVKEGEAQSRFEVVVRRGLTPLIGRDHEFGLLQERWARVKAGSGQVVLLSGEPGIGKSRLVEALKETIEHEGARCLELRCSPYTQNSALQPVIEHLQRALQFRLEDSADEKLQKLEYALEHRNGAYRLSKNSQAQVIASAAKQSLQGTEITSSPPAPRNDTTRLQEMVPLFASLLSLPHPKGYPVLSLSPQKQKEKTQEALVAWLCAEAKQQAVTYAWEDLHWADPSTLEFITLLLAQVPTTRLLAVLTYRPEFTPSWGAHSYLSQLTLSPLGQNHVEAMVEKVTGGKALPREVVQQIVTKTDGVPLFVEELTKMVVEQNVGAYCNTPLLGIPATLQDALMARLDRLGSAKEIAQIGATIGREFNYDLLQAVSPLNEEALQQGLKQLVEAELVFQSGVPPQARYLFKHALVQDTAYQSLLKSRRQQLHQQVAQVLVEQLPQITETQPELVAHHYTEAGLIEQAIPYWQKAGERASQRSAIVEAVHYLSKGIDLLKLLPDTPERAQQELSLQTALGPAWMSNRGYAAPEVESAYLRARELCQQIGETPKLFPILQGLATFHSVRGEYQTGQKLGTQLLNLAQRAQDPALLLRAHVALQSPLFWQGEFTAAYEHAEQGVALYSPLRQHTRVPQVLAQDPGVMCFTYAALALWPLGYPDQALKRMQEAVTLAQELSHPFTLAYAHFSATVICSLCQEMQLTREQAEAAITLAAEHGFMFPLMMAEFGQGWALVRQGQQEPGLKQMRRSLTTLQAMGAKMGGQYQWTQLAEAYGTAGQVEEGLSVLSEAFALMSQTGGHAFGAELYRLKGMLTLQSRRVGNAHQPVSIAESVTVGRAHPTGESEAEACFRKAIEIAQSQQAKSWELRAATSLARLWQQQGKRTEAHKQLSEVYNWFTEGFDTKDLQEAKALLVELAG